MERLSRGRDGVTATDIASEQAGSLFAYAAIMHDLRNSLAAIHSSAEMLISSRLSHPQVHRLARNMYCASVRMRELPGGVPGQEQRCGEQNRTL